MNTPTLSAINPDFDDIAAQLRNALLRKKTWRGLVESSTGIVLMESVAATGAMLMTAVQNAAEEQTSDTARLDSSLKSLARTLGVRLQRKTPASSTFDLTIPSSPTTTTVTAYTQWTASGRRLFNRTAIIFLPGETTKTVTLYEGVVQEYSFTGDGTPFQIYWLNVPGFTVSDRDVIVTADNQPVRVATDALWHYKNVVAGSPTDLTRVVQDRTLPTGELELCFGNNLYAFQPPNASVLSVTYVVTNGLLGNDAGFIGQPIRCETNPSISGVSTSALINGVNEPSAEVYRNSPLVYASYERAVSIDDHEALSLQYDNVVDSRHFGQQLIAPNVKEFMNIVYVYTLQSDGTQFSQPEFDAWLEWFKPKAPPLTYVRKLAVTIPVTVAANVTIRNTGDPLAVLGAILAAIAALFVPKGGYLGRNLHLSDIYDAIKDADPSIDTVDLLSPTGNIICRIDTPAAPALVSNTAGGSLVPGTTYTYAVSALNSQGETFASAISQIVPAAGHNRVVVSWQAVPGATGYRVYGRIDNTMQLMGTTLAANVTSLIDDGSVSLGAAINEINTSGLYYTTLNGTPTININFTARRG